MTLAAEVVKEDQQPIVRCTVGAVPIPATVGVEIIDGRSTDYAAGMPTLLGYNLRKDIETKNPTIDLKFSFIPDWFLDGDAVTVEAGYLSPTDGEQFIRRITGTIQNLQHGVVGPQTVSVYGTMWLLIRQLDAPETVVTGLTVDQAILARLAFVGITDAAINISPFVLGSALEATLAAGQTLDQVTQLADINDGVLYELGTGQIVGVGAMYFLPAPTAFRSFSTVSGGAQVRIIDGSDREDPNYFRDHIVGTGASIPDGDPEDPDTVFDPLTSEVSLIGAGIRQPPAPAGTFATQPVSNDLIDTQAQLDLYVRGKLTKFARIPRYLEIDIIGDPRIELGMTLGVEAPEMRVSGGWFVAAINESWSRGRGLVTTCELTGGSRFGGSIQGNPQAAFTVTTIQQVLNDRLFTIVTADASNSHDPDGDIVSYAWSGAGTGSGVRFVFLIDQDADPNPTLTLEVTDATGLTNSIDQTINTDVNSDASLIAQPSVWVAGGAGGADATPDGGVTWQTFDRGVSVTAVDAKPANGVDTGLAVNGYADGALYRTTNFDAAATEAFAPTGDAILCVWWDKVVPSRVWAGTANGALLMSSDNGATFTVYEAATGYPLWWLATPLPDGIWRGGGRGDQPDTLIRYDPVVGGHAFVSVPIGGALDLTGATAALTCRAAAARLANELMIGFTGELTAAGTNIFHTLTVFNGAGWTKAVGLDGKDNAIAIAPDFGALVFHVMFEGEQSVWQTLDAVNFTESPAVFPAGYSASRALWEGEFLGGLDGIHLVGLVNSGGDGAVMKSKDGLETAEDFYPIAGISTIPGGSQVFDIAIGAPGNGVVQAGAVAYVGGTGYPVDAWDNSTSWVEVRAAFDNGSENGYATAAFLFYRFVSGKLVVQKRTNFGPHFGSIYYSGPTDTGFALLLDSGAAFGDYQPYGMDITAAGVIMVPIAAGTGVGGNQATTPLLIKRSDDEGASYTTETTDPGYTASTNTPIRGNVDNAIACDKWDADRILVIAGRAVSGARPTVIYRDGTGWHQRTVALPDNGTTCNIIAVNSGRMLLFGQAAADSRRSVWPTDDLGATWGARTFTAGAGENIVTCPYRASHFNRVVVGVNRSGGAASGVEISADNGASFAAAAIADFGETIRSMEYDNAADTLYVTLADDTIHMVAGLFGTPVVTDITFNAAFPQVIALQR